MQKIEVISAKNPTSWESSQDAINLEVQFSHLAGPVEFTALQNDSTEHGRDLFKKAKAGVFGKITLNIRPEEHYTQIAEMRRQQRVDAAAKLIAPLQDAVELGIATAVEITKYNQIRKYRVELMRLPQSAGWPKDIVWPTLE